jgi:hypothetical protein
LGISCKNPVDAVFDLQLRLVGLDVDVTRPVPYRPNHHEIDQVHHGGFTGDFPQVANLRAFRQILVSRALHVLDHALDRMAVELLHGRAHVAFRGEDPLHLLAGQDLDMVDRLEIQRIFPWPAGADRRRW